MQYLSLKVNEPYVAEQSPDENFTIPTMYPGRVVFVKSAGKKYVKDEAANTWVDTSIPKTPKPIVEISTSLNENETVTGTITNYNSDIVYTITANAGTIEHNGSSGSFTYTAPDITNETNMTDKIKIYGVKSGYNPSEVVEIDIAVAYLSAIADQVLQVVDFNTTADEIDGYRIDNGKLIAKKDLAEYISKVIEQESEDSDWIEYIPRIEYKPKQLLLDSGTTNTTLKIRDDINVNDVLRVYNDTDGYKKITVDSISQEDGNDVIPLIDNVFNNGATYNISTTLLSNGNTLIAYHDNSNNGYGTFIIVDSNGNIVKDETVFHNGSTEFISPILLSNDNVLIAYTDGSNHNYGTFVIVDSNGNIVKNETVFNSGYTNYISTTLLSNGSILIAYRDNANNNYGTFVIVNSNGNIVKDETVFYNSETYYISPILLSNGNVLIAYTDGSNHNYGTFVIVDSNGNIVKDKTVFNNGDTRFISTTSLSNSNVLIAYQDFSNNHYGTFVIVDPNGNIVKNETVFYNGETSNISTTLLSNDNVLIVYRDNSNNGHGTFVIVDSNGNIVKDKTVFNNGSIGYISSILLSNGNVLVAYKDINNNDYGTLTILSTGKVNAIPIEGFTEAPTVVYKDQTPLLKLSTGLTPNRIVKHDTLLTKISSTTTHFKGKLNQVIDLVAGDDIVLDNSIQTTVSGIDLVVHPEDYIPGSETVFNSGNTYYISTTLLSNGNVLIAYQDSSNNDYGTFVIVDYNGNIVKNETVFNNGGTYHISTTSLSNGNVLIAYRDNSNNYYGTFVIVDSNGNIVKDETVFNNGSTNSISTTSLSNGNVLIAYGYKDGSDNRYGTFVIVDSNGNIVKDKTIFNNGTTYEISTTLLSNGNVLIAYRDYSNNGYGTFVIVDSNGNIIVDETVFNSSNTGSISTTLLSNDNVLIAYRDTNNNNQYGAFVIVDSNGTIVKDKTLFNNGDAYDISTTLLSNGNVLIAYTDHSNNDYGTFVIVDSNGDIVKNEIVYNSGYSYNISTTLLSNDNILIAYTDSSNNHYGTFVIVKYTSLEAIYDIDFDAVDQAPNSLTIPSRFEAISPSNDNFNNSVFNLEYPKLSDKFRAFAYELVADEGTTISKLTIDLSKEP